MFLFNIPSIIPHLLLKKQIRFGDIKIIEIIGASLQAIITITLALTTELNYWCLVIGMLISTLVIHLLYFFRMKWYPTLKFSRESFNYLFRFGIYVQGGRSAQ